MGGAGGKRAPAGNACSALRSDLAPFRVSPHRAKAVGCGPCPTSLACRHVTSIHKDRPAVAPRLRARRPPLLEYGEGPQEGAQPRSWRPDAALRAEVLESGRHEGRAPGGSRPLRLTLCTNARARLRYSEHGADPFVCAGRQRV